MYDASGRSKAEGRVPAPLCRSLPGSLLNPRTLAALDACARQLCGPGTFEQALPLLNRLLTYDIVTNLTTELCRTAGQRVDSRLPSLAHAVWMAHAVQNRLLPSRAVYEVYSECREPASPALLRMASLARFDVEVAHTLCDLLEALGNWWPARRQGDGPRQLRRQLLTLKHDAGAPFDAKYRDFFGRLIAEGRPSPRDKGAMVALTRLKAAGLLPDAHEVEKEFSLARADKFRHAWKVAEDWCHSDKGRACMWRSRPNWVVAAQALARHLAPLRQQGAALRPGPVSIAMAARVGTGPSREGRALQLARRLVETPSRASLSSAATSSVGMLEISPESWTESWSSDTSSWRWNAARTPSQGPA